MGEGCSTGSIKLPEYMRIWFHGELIIDMIPPYEKHRTYPKPRLVGSFDPYIIALKDYKLKGRVFLVRSIEVFA